EDHDAVLARLNQAPGPGKAPDRQDGWPWYNTGWTPPANPQQGQMTETLQMNDSPSKAVPIPKTVWANAGVPQNFGQLNIPNNWTSARWAQKFTIQVAACTKQRALDADWRFWSYASAIWNEQ